MTDLSFSVNFCIPKMEPSNGLMNGMDVSIAGGSLES